MRVVLIGFFAADYLIALANSLAKGNDVTLILARHDVAQEVHVQHAFLPF